MIDREDRSVHDDSHSPPHRPGEGDRRQLAGLTLDGRLLCVATVCVASSPAAKHTFVRRSLIHSFPLLIEDLPRVGGTRSLLRGRCGNRYLQQFRSPQNQTLINLLEISV